MVKNKPSLKPPKPLPTLASKGFVNTQQTNRNNKRPKLTEIAKLNLNIKKNKAKTLFPETVKKKVEV
tara:strand:- start:855 stop:1055 length:201 start_codon:yes stop_codon:yes gene_type:complete